MSGAIHVSVFVRDDTEAEARFVAPTDGREPYFLVDVGECSLFASRANLERISAAITAALKEKSK